MPTQGGELRVDLQGNEVDRVFFDPVFLEDIETSGYTVMTNVVNKKPIGFVEKMQKILQKNTGCGWNPKGDVSMYERSVEVENIKLNIETCAFNLNNTIWEETKRKGTQAQNTIGTVTSNILLSRARQGVILDVNRLFWFGNKASVDTDYNLLDGMWTVHIPKLVTSGATPYVSSGSGSPLALNDATQILEEMYDEQSIELLGIPDSEKRFKVSRSIYQAYMKDLKAAGGGDAGRSALINGVPVMAFNGIPLQQEVYWSHYDATDLSNPNMHRALLTVPSNLVIATDLMSSMNTLEIWYERKEQLVLTRAEFKLGTNFVHPTLMVAAF